MEKGEILRVTLLLSVLLSASPALACPLGFVKLDECYCYKAKGLPMPDGMLEVDTKTPPIRAPGAPAHCAQPMPPTPKAAGTAAPPFDEPNAATRLMISCPPEVKLASPSGSPFLNLSLGTVRAGQISHLALTGRVSACVFANHISHLHTHAITGHSSLRIEGAEAQLDVSHIHGYRGDLQLVNMKELSHLGSMKPIEGRVHIRGPGKIGHLHVNGEVYLEGVAVSHATINGRLHLKDSSIESLNWTDGSRSYSGPAGRRR